MEAPEVKYTVEPKIIIAFVERRGDYTGAGEAMHELKKWIDSRGIEQARFPFCLTFDNPSETAKAGLRSEVCVPVTDVTGPGAGFLMQQPSRRSSVIVD